VNNETKLVPWLYIAGPYSTPDPVHNTNVAVRVATAVMEETEWVPFVPHLTMLWHTITPRDYEFWLDLDEFYLSRCDLVLRLPGESTGADREVSRAREWGIEVLGIEDMPVSVQRTYMIAKALPA
jgi:hypothetical protein